MGTVLRVYIPKPIIMNISCICSIYEFFAQPENWKDYIIPFISPIIGVAGAYWVMFVQLKNLNKKDLEVQSKRLNDYKNVIYRTTPTIIKLLNKKIDSLTELIPKLELTDNYELTRTLFNFPQAEIIVNIPFHEALDSISIEDEKDRDIFSEVYFEMQTLQKNNDDYLMYFESEIENLNTVRSEFNEYFKREFIKIQKIIFEERNVNHLVYYRRNLNLMFFTNQYERDKYNYGNYISELEHFYFSIQQNSQENAHKSQITAVAGLLVLFKNRRYLRFIDIEMAQNFNDLFRLLQLAERTMEVLKKTTENYLTIFGRVLSKVEKLQKIASAPQK